METSLFKIPQTESIALILIQSLSLEKKKKRQLDALNSIKVCTCYTISSFRNKNGWSDFGFKYV